MNNQEFMQERLDFLRLVFPPTGIVHVGAGTGTVAERYESWDVPAAIFIEADEAQFDKLNALVSSKSGWTANLAVVSNQQAETDFYVASNPRESGLIPPENLTGLWRNLKTSSTQPRQTITLERLLASQEIAACPMNWLVIDCLPAASILEGAELEAWDVILARVILDAEHYQGLGASKAEVDALLEARGYRFVICEDELHPSLGMALYVRDRKSRLVQLQDQLDWTEASLQEHAARISELTQERDRQAKQLAEQVDEIVQASYSRAVAEKRSSDLQQRLDQLNREQVEQARRHQENQHLLEKQGQEKASLVKSLNSLQEQLAEQQRQTEYWHQEVTRFQQVYEEKKKHIEQLEQRLAEQDHRQRLLDEEVLKAEAQIELIKDILLREKAF